MIVYLLQVTLCMAIFYCFYLFALQKETTFQTNRIYLISTLIVSLILPLIKIYFERNSVADSVTQPLFIGNYFDSFQQTVVVTAEEKSIPWMDYFSWIYLAGCLVMTVRLSIEIIKILKLNKKGTRLIITGYSCILSDKIQSPFSFFNSIYLPTDHQFSDEELAEVLAHEHSHISGRHSIDVLFLEIVKSFLWISPMIYLYRIKLREVHEFLADAAVLKNSPWENYARFLVTQKYVGLQSQLTNQLIYSQLKNRLMMMTQKPSSALAKWKYSGVIPILLMAMLIFSFREKEQKQMTQSDKASIISDQSPGTTSYKVYNIYKDGLKIYGFEITEQPLFPGCDKVNVMEKADCSQKKMYEYLAQHLKYPEEMKTQKIEGKVYVKFNITNIGYVADARIEKSLNPAADKAALDVVNGMNDNVGKWTPGTKEGKPVMMDMVLPISFVLGTASDQGAKPNHTQGATLIEMPSQSDEPFTYVEHMPTFPEGQDVMYKFIYERIKYPATARENGISGMVIIQFVVSKEGDIQNAKVVRGIGGGCNEEALRVINEMPRWNPGQHDGRNVPVTFTLPIKFVLQDPKPNTSNSSASPENSQAPASSNTLEETTVISLGEPAKNELIEETKELKLSPNPATDHIIIELFDGAKTINIFDAKGALVMKKDLNELTNKKYQLDITSIPAGIFTIQVTSNYEIRAGSFTKVK